MFQNILPASTIIEDKKAPKELILRFTAHPKIRMALLGWLNTDPYPFQGVLGHIYKKITNLNKNMEYFH